MVDFGGWDMPVQYTGIIDEHHAVRRAVGLFYVSHMGEIEIRGPQSFDLLTTSPRTPFRNSRSARRIISRSFTSTADSSTTSWFTKSLMTTTSFA